MLENEVIDICNKPLQKVIYRDSKTSERRNMGKALAELYLTSHDVSPELFQQVCKIKESFQYDIFVQYGFNEGIRHSVLDYRKK